MSVDLETVHIPKAVYDDIRKRVRASGEFTSVDDYVTFVLGKVLEEKPEAEAVYSPEEEEQVKERLRRLGYT